VGLKVEVSMAIKQYIKVEDREHLPLEHESRNNRRNYSGLCEQLSSKEVTERRWAIRDLSGYPESAPDLLKLLESNPCLAEREALFDSLQLIGGETVIKGALQLLHSEYAGLRNGAIEILQSKPDMTGEHIEELLTDSDSDIRIFAIDILQKLPHEKTPEWLIGVIKYDKHINVLASAVDRLAEVGTKEMIPELEGLKQKFNEESYLCFAIDLAITRIQGD